MQVVTEATTTAAGLLALDAVALAAILGVTETAVERMQRLDQLLSKGSPPFDRALRLIRLFRSLNALTGGDREAARLWLKSPNPAFGTAPAEKIVTEEGLCDVLAHLDTQTLPSEACAGLKA